MNPSEIVDFELLNRSPISSGDQPKVDIGTQPSAEILKVLTYATPAGRIFR